LKFGRVTRKSVKLKGGDFLSGRNSVNEILEMLLSNDPKRLLEIQFLNRNGIKEAKKILEDFLIWCLAKKKWKFTVITSDSILDSQQYTAMFAKNYVDSMITTGKYLLNNFSFLDVLPKTLYHGTTTVFLPSIIEYGLSPSKAGQCWVRDKEKLVFLTDNLCAAENFARCAVLKFRGYPVILCIDVTVQKGIAISPERLRWYKNVSETYKRFICQGTLPSDTRDWYVLPKRRLLSSLMCRIKKGQF
jgi:hypothetical protein